MPFRTLTDDRCHTSTKDDDNSEELAKESRNNFTSQSCQEVLVVFRQLLPNLIPVYIAWFSEYMTIQSVITTLAFPSAPFKSRDHYEYYIFVFLGGEVMGRCYLMIVSYVKAEWAEKAKFPYFWILSATQIVHLLFFILAAWYRFLPSVWIVLLLLFTCGTAIGVFYVNAVIFFRNEFQDRDNEFAIGYLAVAIAGGVFAAAFLGLYTEPILREHCTMFVSNSDFCFTRSMYLDDLSKPCLI